MNAIFFVRGADCVIGVGFLPVRRGHSQVICSERSTAVSDQLTGTSGGKFDLAAAEGRMNPYEWISEAELLYKRGRLDEVEALIYSHKMMQGIDLTERVAQHAIAA